MNQSGQTMMYRKTISLIQLKYQKTQKRAHSYSMDTLKPDTLLAWWQLLAILSIYKAGKAFIIKGHAASEQYRIALMWS